MILITMLEILTAPRHEESYVFAIVCIVTALPIF